MPQTQVTEETPRQPAREEGRTGNCPFFFLFLVISTVGIVDDMCSYSLCKTNSMKTGNKRENLNKPPDESTRNTLCY